MAHSRRPRQRPLIPHDRSPTLAELKAAADDQSAPMKDTPSPEAWPQIPNFGRFDNSMFAPAAWKSLYLRIFPNLPGSVIYLLYGAAHEHLCWKHRRTRIDECRLNRWH